MAKRPGWPGIAYFVPQDYQFCGQVVLANVFRSFSEWNQNIWSVCSENDGFFHKVFTVSVKDEWELDEKAQGNSEICILLNTLASAMVCYGVWFVFFFLLCVSFAYFCGLMKKEAIQRLLKAANTSVLSKPTICSIRCERMKALCYMLNCLRWWLLFQVVGRADAECQTWAGSSVRPGTGALRRGGVHTWAWEDFTKSKMMPSKQQQVRNSWNTIQHHFFLWFYFLSLLFRRFLGTTGVCVVILLYWGHKEEMSNSIVVSKNWLKGRSEILIRISHTQFSEVTLRLISKSEKYWLISDLFVFLQLMSGKA